MIMACAGAYCTFAVETFFKTNEFVIFTQRAYHVNFMLDQNDAVLEKKIQLIAISIFYPEQHYFNLT